MQLVLDTKGLRISRKSGVFHVEYGKSKRAISPVKLSSIAVTTTVELGSDAILLAIEKEIPILFLDRLGRVKGQIWSAHFPSLATLRRQQVQFADVSEATAWVVGLFELKTEHQLDTLRFLRKAAGGLGMNTSAAISNIRRNGRSFDQYRPLLLEKARTSIMGTEGTIARIYWQAIGATLPRAYRFNERSRRPARDIFNAALNYLYGMLYGTVESGVFAAGLDPHLGLLHVDAHQKPTLAFDLIEPFRPWVDQLLIKACLEKKLTKQQFTRNQYGLFLNKKGKELIIPMFNDFLRSERNWMEQNATVRNHIYHLSARLVQRIRATFSS